MTTTTSLPDSLTEFYGEPISTYTRADAIADGTLVVPNPATVKEAGYNIPLAMTAAAHADAVAWDDTHDKRKGGFTGQSVEGRLWDVLHMGRGAARVAFERAMRDGTGVHYFELYRIKPEGRGTMPRRTALKVHVGGDDNRRPCITIMLPHED